MIVSKVKEINKISRMEAIKNSLFCFLVVLTCSCNAEQQGDVIFYQNENEFNAIAELMVVERPEMIAKSKCGVSEQKEISFTPVSLTKCFNHLGQEKIDRIVSFMNDLEISYIDIYPKMVRFQLPVSSNMLLTDFEYVVYSIDDVAPEKVCDRQRVNKIKDRWYLYKETQDTY